MIFFDYFSTSGFIHVGTNELEIYLIITVDILCFLGRLSPPLWALWGDNLFSAVLAIIL